jgi:hypothetical protein
LPPRRTLKKVLPSRPVRTEERLWSFMV